MTRFADWILNTVPEFLFALGMLSLLVLAAVIGRTIRRYRARKKGLALLEVAQEGYVVSAVLGLLALLMGFTFSMAADQYNQRRLLVIEEANALSSTYRLAQSFEEPHRSTLSRTLGRYVDQRVITGRETDPGRVAEQLRASRAMEDEVWTAALSATASLRDGIASSFLLKTNDALEAAERREVARLTHLPTLVHTVLLSYMLITAGVMGYAFANAPQLVSSGTLFTLLTISMLLIIDLDRPTSGMVLESQYPMESLQADLAKIASGPIGRP